MSDITVVKDLFKLSIAGDAFLTPCSCTYSKLRRFWPRLFCLTRVYIEKHGAERQKVFFSLSLSFILWMNENFKIITYYIPILCSIVNFEFFSLWISLMVNLKEREFQNYFCHSLPPSIITYNNMYYLVFEFNYFSSCFLHPASLTYFFFFFTINHNHTSYFSQATLTFTWWNL